MGRVGGPDPQDLLLEPPSPGQGNTLHKAALAAWGRQGARAPLGVPTPANQAMGSSGWGSGGWSRGLLRKGQEHRGQGQVRQSRGT